MVLLVGAGQFLFDDLFKSRKGLGADHRATVDDKGGRAGNKFSGDFFQLVLVERPAIFPGLIVEQSIMVSPKCILVGSAFTGLGCPHRFCAQERKMPVSKPYLVIVYVDLINLTARVSGKTATEWSLEIRFRVAFEMTRLGDQKVHHFLAGNVLFRGALWG